MAESPLTKVSKSKKSSDGGDSSVVNPLLMYSGGASKAQKLAHQMADPKGINAKHKPDEYGERLERAWAQVLPAFAPASGEMSEQELTDKIQEVVREAFKVAEKEDIRLLKAIPKAQKNLGFVAPASGPPPPVPGKKAPSQAGAGHNGSIAGSPMAKEAMNRAQKYMDDGMGRSEAFKKAWSEIKD